MLNFNYDIRRDIIETKISFILFNCIIFPLNYFFKFTNELELNQRNKTKKI